MKTLEKLDTHIRWMIRRDMPEVLQIDQRCFQIPWNEEDFLRSLRQRNCIGMVSESLDKVMGFMIYELHKDRLEVLKFAVHHDFHGHSIGSQMIAKLKSKLQNHRRTRLEIVVRETNLKTQMFLRRHRFLAERVLRKHFGDSGEDGFLMAFELPD